MNTNIEKNWDESGGGVSEFTVSSLETRDDVSLGLGGFDAICIGKHDAF